MDPQDPIDLKAISDILYLGQKGRQAPGRRIFELMFPQNKEYCRTVVLEDDYIDDDYLVSYSRFYYHSHSPISKYCQRMHFFSNKLEHKDLFELNLSHQKSYLGFTVIRPTPVNVIGRTVIRPQIQESDTDYVTCAESYDVNLAGNKLKATGACFQQQDSQVAACATSAVYMTICYMARKFGLAYRTTAEISEMASQIDSFLGRGIPSRGLSTNQMGRVLNSIGYDTIIYGEESDTLDLKDAIYKTIESEIPVIITFEMISGSAKGKSHAITIIGHQWNNEKSIKWEAKSTEIYELDGTRKQQHYFTTVSLIGKFITLDDTRGPHRTLWFDASKPKILYCEDSDPTQKITCIVQSIIIPLPRGIWLSGEQAERKALNLLVASGLELPEDIVLRTYLRASNQLKVECASPLLKVPEEIQKRIRGTQMPKYIWITEVTDEKLSTNKLKLGDVIIDPSSSPWTSDFMALHVGGRRLLNDAVTSVPYNGWQGPYPMLCRPSLDDRHLAQFK